ncbi:MAG: lipoyl(octanoyl) transferase LipB [Gammaproteobacteria bacterium]|nr:lipoyl(octanoyl) transferase LipB [Gammaproteobacteria bacterium]
MPSPSPVTAHPLLIRHLGLVDYQQTFTAMRDFTAARTASTTDEIWLLQHPPTFTQGMNGKAEHLLTPGDIPVIEVDRGGQATYHGPGQLIVYLLLDLRRRKMGVRQLVSALEQAVIGLLADHHIDAHARPDAPGVYVAGAKVAALGLRIKRGCSYHGLSLNVAMDLDPFSRINPCGHPGMAVTDLRRLGLGSSIANMERLSAQLLTHLQQQLERVGTTTPGNAPPLS